MNNSGSWDAYVEGMSIDWQFSFSVDDMVLFSELSGDYNPIHLDADFAKAKGFDLPLIYGLLLSSQVSRLIGQELPDKNTVLTGFRIDFMKPSFPEDRLFFSADLITKSSATSALEFKFRILRKEQALCRGLVDAVWLP